MPGIVRSCERDGERERERFVMKRKVEGMSHTHISHIFYIYVCKQ